MAVRNAKSMVLRAEVHDYRLNEVRGKELRDMTVGVVGTGRIGAAVIDRLRGFGCRILACDSGPKTCAEYVSLDQLLQLSDIVTLHTPLNADTHHLLNRRRIEQMKRGAFIVNTGRGSWRVTVAASQSVGGVDFGNAEYSTASGVMFNDVDGDHVRQARHHDGDGLMRCVAVTQPAVLTISPADDLPSIAHRTAMLMPRADGAHVR